MKNTLKMLSILLAAVCLLCACGSTAQAGGNKGPVIALDEEDQELLELLGSDIQVVAPEDFAAALQGLTADANGKLYQLTGYCAAPAEGDDTPALADAEQNPSASIPLRYLTRELTPGDRYTVTGVITIEEHDGHSHISLDVLTVESFTEK